MQRIHQPSADWPMWLIGGVVVVGGALFAAAQLPARLIHGGWIPSSGTAWMWSSYAMLAHVGDPGRAWPASARPMVPGPITVWGTFALLLAVAVAIAGMVAGWRPSERGVLRRRRRPGFAGAAVVAAALSPQAVRRAAQAIKSSVPAAALQLREDGVYLGTDAASGRPIRGKPEDSYAIAGPPRSGKSMALLVENISTWRGPAVIPSTKPDLLLHCALLPGMASRPLYVFNPTRLGQWRDTVHWSPITGCEDPEVALSRATAFVAGSDAGVGVKNGGFWRNQAVMIYARLLHAASLGEADMRTLKAWAAEANYARAISILDENPEAAVGWSAELAAAATYGSEQRGGVVGTLLATLSCLDNPRVMDACCPQPGDSTFDAASLLDRGGRLFLVGASDAQLNMAPLITAMVGSVVDEAKRRAAAAAGQRLDPALGLFLDEAAQIAPLPTLPRLVADGGGQGITTFVVLQSLAQARGRWGADDAAALWGACTAKVVFGGLSEKVDLEAISALCPEVDERVTSHSSNGRGERSHSVSQRRVPALTPAQVRAIEEWHAVLFYRHHPPVELSVPGWWSMPRFAVPVEAAKAAFQARWGGAPS